VTADNRYNRATALKNAERFVHEAMDLVIEFQTVSEIAPVLSSMYRGAGIPVIAVEIPHPGATYYGADNYRAGQIGGRYLGRWALKHWQGEVDEVILVELDLAGALPQSRITGMLDGMRDVLGPLDNSRIVRLNGNGQFEASLRAVRKHQRARKARHVLVGAVNDPSALGALRAFEEAGRAQHCAVMAQNASDEGREELRRPGTRLIGSVAYFPERYGPEIIALALDILGRKPVPPAVFTRHKLVTPGNVDQMYPNDPRESE
jgi:ribose transport system substrate-binding protein